MIQIADFLHNYSDFKRSEIAGRYLPPERLRPILEELDDNFFLQAIGKSVGGRPVHSVEIGNGPVKVLVWSQMHGNESTTTKGLLDLFSFFRNEWNSEAVKEILERCTFLFIPMLNPDGAAAYTRENSRGIDLNRDALLLQEPESRILRECFENFGPAFCLNLHDQRSIFGVGTSGKPATLSFLAPAMNDERQINSTRKTAMQIISSVNRELQRVIPGQVGRFDDSFNENCTGDYFQKRGVPTILFEAGHFPGDYSREKTREFFTFSLVCTLSKIASQSYHDPNVSEYLKIGENKKNFCDLIFRNARYMGKIVDVALQYREKLKAGEISFLPEIYKIDEQLLIFGHREIDCQKKPLEFEVEENPAMESVTVRRIMLNKIEFSIKVQ